VLVGSSPAEVKPNKILFLAFSFSKKSAVFKGNTCKEETVKKRRRCAKLNIKKCKKNLSTNSIIYPHCWQGWM
jgi:hypothetical protein